MATVETRFNVGAIEAEENLIIDVQFLLEDIMHRKGISRTELANRLGVSKGRLSQFFKSDANLTLRSIAKAAYAMGERLSVAEAKHNIIQKLKVASAYEDIRLSNPASTSLSSSSVKDFKRVK